MSALTDLQAAVQKDTDVENSAITLLQGLKTQLDAAISSNDPAQLVALSNQIGQNTDALASAVAANTPVPPAPSDTSTTTQSSFGRSPSQKS